MEELLLTIYFLVVFYVLYQMALSLEDKLEDKVVINLKKDFLEEQTQSQLSCQKEAKNITASVDDIELTFKQLKIQYTVLSFTIKKKLTPSQLNLPIALEMKRSGFSEAEISEAFKKQITIRVEPSRKQPLKAIPFISVTAKNDTDDMQLYINWDHSSLEMNGQGNRVIRSAPNMPRDLSQPQIFSLINPGQSVNSNITVESNFFNNPDTNQIELAKPIVDLKEIVESAELTDPTTDEKNIQPLYNLDLMVGIKHVTVDKDDLINLLVPFSFELEIKPDKPAFPPMRWLLRHFGRRNRPEGSWFWGQPQSNRR